MKEKLFNIIISKDIDNDLIIDVITEKNSETFLQSNECVIDDIINQIIKEVKYELYQIKYYPQKELLKILLQNGYSGLNSDEDFDEDDYVMLKYKNKVCYIYPAIQLIHIYNEDSYEFLSCNFNSIKQLNYLLLAFNFPEIKENEK